MEKAIFCLVLLLSLTVAAFAKNNAASSFLSFKATHNKEYTSPEEETRRFEIFQNNIRLAEQWNRELNTDAFGVESPFADMTQEEFAETYLMNPIVAAQAAQSFLSEGAAEMYQPSEEDLVEISPEGVATFDWSTKMPSAISAVKNQGGCGSCWAFSATETLESQWVINGNSPVVLAPQQYVDCTYPGQDGCNGGWYGTAWNYAMGTTGQALETSYPYKAVYSGSCKFVSSTGVVKPTGIVNIADQSALLTYVTNVGPASVAVDASKWYLYRGGNAIYPAQNCTGAIDHAVVATGYQNINGQDVWRVRNSWGTGWGNMGYIYVPFGACSIEKYAQGVKTSSSGASASASRKVLPSTSSSNSRKFSASRSRAPSPSHSGSRKYSASRSRAPALSPSNSPKFSASRSRAPVASASSTHKASSCVPAHSLGQCVQCLNSTQCISGYYCCPYMKKCVASSSMPCAYPIADCSPMCYDGMDVNTCTCSNTNFPNNWQKPTC